MHQVGIQSRLLELNNRAKSLSCIFAEQHCCELFSAFSILSSPESPLFQPCPAHYTSILPHSSLFPHSGKATLGNGSAALTAIESS